MSQPRIFTGSVIAEVEPPPTPKIQTSLVVAEVEPPPTPTIFTASVVVEVVQVYFDSSEGPTLQLVQM